MHAIQEISIETLDTGLKDRHTAVTQETDLGFGESSPDFIKQPGSQRALDIAGRAAIGAVHFHHEAGHGAAHRQVPHGRVCGV